MEVKQSQQWREGLFVQLEHIITNASRFKNSYILDDGTAV